MWNLPYVNAFSERSAQAIADALATVTSRAPLAPNEWGFTADQIAAAKSAEQLLASAIADQNVALAAEKAATQRKAQAKEIGLSALNALATEAYANGNVDDILLAKVGFAPRPVRGGRPKTPVTVADLKAVLTSSGTCRLSWSRGANSERTTFTVEASVDGVSWTLVAATPRVSLTLDDALPGTTRWFRVTASNAGVSARPSAAVAIYGPAQPAAVQLRVA